MEKSYELDIEDRQVERKLEKYRKIYIEYRKIDIEYRIIDI